MTFVLNALLERVAIENRTAIVTQFLNPTGGLSLPGGINIGSDEGLRQLLELLKASPALEQALAQRIATAQVFPQLHSQVQEGTVQPPHGPAPQIQLDTTGSVPVALVPAPPAAGVSPQPRAPRTRHDAPETWPRGAKKWDDALDAYITYFRATTQTQNQRTGDDKRKLLKSFHAFLLQNFPELGANPWVHSIHAGHVSAFLTQEASKAGKRKNEEGGSERAAPRTMLKKLSDLTHAFDYFLQKKVTQELVSGDLTDERAAWTKRANEEDVHYRPYTDEHLKTIFKPEAYLKSNRDPLFFWSPLLGLYLFGRLGDFVRASLASVGHIPEINVWFLDVVPEEAKNRNSVRRLPIPQPLVELGFIEYVEHIRRLGAKYLFPTWNWETPTSQRDPSKNASRAFGVHLDSVGLTDPLLVHHSFRHTGVGALQDAGVPLSHAMQIAGHEAQDHAIRTKVITPEQARSVHLKVYTHADLKRMGTDYPILTLKSALERSMKPPIDHAGLRIAADIVKQHVRKVGDHIRGGWPTQNQRYTSKQLEILRSRMGESSSNW